MRDWRRSFVPVAALHVAEEIDFLVGQGTSAQHLGCLLQCGQTSMTFPTDSGTSCSMIPPFTFLFGFALV